MELILVFVLVVAIAETLFPHIICSQLLPCRAKVRQREGGEP
jgi:hypothetical protein